MYYTMRTKRGFIVGTAREVVLAMRAGNMFTADQGKLDYMEGVATRIFQTTGKSIAHDSPESFLSALEERGHITLTRSK